MFLRPRFLGALWVFSGRGWRSRGRALFAMGRGPLAPPMACTRRISFATASTLSADSESGPFNCKASFSCASSSCNLRSASLHEAARPDSFSVPCRCISMAAMPSVTSSLAIRVAILIPLYVFFYGRDPVVTIGASRSSAVAAPAAGLLRAASLAGRALFGLWPLQHFAPRLRTQSPRLPRGSPHMATARPRGYFTFPTATARCVGESYYKHSPGSPNRIALRRPVHGTLLDVSNNFNCHFESPPGINCARNLLFIVRKKQILRPAAAE